MTKVDKKAIIKIPQRADSAMLAKLGNPGEPLVLVKMAGFGSLAPYEFRGRDSRTFLLRWDARLCAHILRVPLSLWMQDDHRMAHDILDQRRLEAPVIILFELPDPVSEPKTGAPPLTKMPQPAPPQLTKGKGCVKSSRKA